MEAGRCPDAAFAGGIGAAVYRDVEARRALQRWQSRFQSRSGSAGSPGAERAGGRLERRDQLLLAAMDWAHRSPLGGPREQPVQEPITPVAEPRARADAAHNGELSPRRQRDRERGRVHRSVGTQSDSRSHTTPSTSHISSLRSIREVPSLFEQTEHTLSSLAPLDFQSPAQDSLSTPQQHFTSLSSLGSSFLAPLRT
jgi:hypothetical protein